jgi:hypothetical protein
VFPLFSFIISAFVSMLTIGSCLSCCHKNLIFRLRDTDNKEQMSFFPSFNLIKHFSHAYLNSLLTNFADAILFPIGFRSIYSISDCSGSFSVCVVSLLLTRIHGYDVSTKSNFTESSPTPNNFFATLFGAFQFQPIRPECMHSITKSCISYDRLHFEWMKKYVFFSLYYFEKLERRFGFLFSFSLNIRSISFSKLFFAYTYTHKLTELLLEMS